LHQLDERDRQSAERRAHRRAGRGLFGGRAGFATGPRIARRQPRPEPLLRGHRQAGRRADPRQDLDQRPPARMNDIPGSPAAHNWAVDPVMLAAELIRRPSITPRDEGALDIVAGRLERLGFTCHPLTFAEEGPNGEKSEPVANLYARWGNGRPNLCFAGHTDVVPTGAADQWSFDPFGAALRDGVLCGRGAVDMKGAIAAFIAAAERFIATRGPDFPGSISLLITGDEEGVAVNGTKKVLDWLKSRRSEERRVGKECRARGSPEQ